MDQRRQRPEHTQISVGFAADVRGSGVAYAAIESPSGKPQVLRIPFRVTRFASLLDREVAYAALRAVAEAMNSAGYERIVLKTLDSRVVADLSERRALPSALAMPYVALGCSLNRFKEADVIFCDDGRCRDLAARALAEVTLHIAA